jgi:hypothetical protein
MARAIGWLSMYVGLEYVLRRGPTAARRADALAAIPGVEILTPRHQMGTLVSFRIGGWPAEAALEELGARVFAIARTIPIVDALRISVGFFNSDDEIDRFVGAVRLLAAHTPETLPPRRTLAILGQDERRAAAPLVVGDPLAAVPQRSPPGRPGGRREPRRGDRPGTRLPRLRRRPEPRCPAAGRRPADPRRGHRRGPRARPREPHHLPDRSAPEGRRRACHADRLGAALGLFAAVPIAYLVLVVASQLLAAPDVDRHRDRGRSRGAPP